MSQKGGIMPPEGGIIHSVSQCIQIAGLRCPAKGQIRGEGYMLHMVL